MNKIVFILVNIVFFTTSCENDDNVNVIDQINIVAQGDCMEADIDGLIASLCILDTSGNPKTTLDQNENFIIALTFQNETGENIKIKKEYLNGGSVMVVKGADDGNNYGKPYTSVWCTFDGNPYMEAMIDDNYLVSSPWVIQNEIPIRGDICKTESNEYLSQGNYYVEVSLDFTLEKGEKTFKVSGESNLILEFSVQ